MARTAHEEHRQQEGPQREEDLHGGEGVRGGGAEGRERRQPQDLRPGVTAQVAENETQHSPGEHHPHGVAVAEARQETARHLAEADESEEGGEERRALAAQDPARQRVKDDQGERREQTRQQLPEPQRIERGELRHQSQRDVEETLARVDRDPVAILVEGGARQDAIALEHLAQAADMVGEIGAETEVAPRVEAEHRRGDQDQRQHRDRSPARGDATLSMLLVAELVGAPQDPLPGIVPVPGRRRSGADGRASRAGGAVEGAVAGERGSVGGRGGGRGGGLGRIRLRRPGPRPGRPRRAPQGALRGTGGRSGERPRAARAAADLQRVADDDRHPAQQEKPARAHADRAQASGERGRPRFRGRHRAEARVAAEEPGGQAEDRDDRHAQQQRARESRDPADARARQDEIVEQPARQQQHSGHGQRGAQDLGQERAAEREPGVEQRGERPEQMPGTDARCPGRPPRARSSSLSRRIHAGTPAPLSSSACGS